MFDMKWLIPHGHYIQNGCLLMVIKEGQSGATCSDKQLVRLQIHKDLIYLVHTKNDHIS